MTVKESIARFHANYLKSKIQKKAKLNAPQKVLDRLQREMKDYMAGDFHIGMAGKGGNWDVSQNTLFDDTITSGMPVMKIEAAMGKGRFNELMCALRLIGVDGNIYYYDNMGLLTVVRPRMEARIKLIEEFAELELH